MQRQQEQSPTTKELQNLGLLTPLDKLTQSLVHGIFFCLEVAHTCICVSQCVGLTAPWKVTGKYSGAASRIRTRNTAF